VELPRWTVRGHLQSAQRIGVWRLLLREWPRSGVNEHGGYGATLDLLARRELASLPGHIGSAWGVAFSRDGRRLATGGGDTVGGQARDALKLWDFATHRQLLTLPGDGQFFFDVSFSPDGTPWSRRPAVGSPISGVRPRGRRSRSPSAKDTRNRLPMIGRGGVEFGNQSARLPESATGATSDKQGMRFCCSTWSVPPEPPQGTSTRLAVPVRPGIVWPWAPSSGKPSPSASARPDRL